MSDHQGIVAGDAGAAGIPIKSPSREKPLRPAPRHPFGRGLVDKFTDVVGTPLHKVSPLFGNAYDNGATLRTLLGNGYFIVVLLGGYLGGLAVKNTHGFAVPPVLWLTVTIMVLGILDAFTGLVATTVFAVGVIATGHLFSSHLLSSPPGTQGMLYAFTGILTMAFLWFIGPQLPRRIRLLGFRNIKSPLQRRWTMAADLFVVTLLMILILGSLPLFVPLFTGAPRQHLVQVVLQNHLVLIKVAVGIAAFVRVIFDEIVHSRYDELPKSLGRHRGPEAKWFLRGCGALIALALIWEIVGTTWQWPVIWVLLVSLELFSAAGERFLRPSAIYRYVPRNLFRIVTLLLFDEYAARVLSGRLISGVELLAWLVLLLVIVIAVYAILDGPDDLDEGNRPATWLTRIIGVLVVIALFVLSQGIYTVPAAPYLNPAALSVSGNGTLFIADTGNNRVIAVAPDGQRYPVGSGLLSPGGVAADPNDADAVYVTDSGAGEVLEVDWRTSQAASAFALRPMVDDALINGGSGGVVTVVDRGLNDPRGLAVDAEGRLFIADSGVGTILEVRPGHAPQIFASGLDDPVAVATDPFGHLFVTDTGRGTVLRYTIASNGDATHEMTVLKGLKSPAGVAADAQGNLYVSNSGANDVLELHANGHRSRVKGTFVDPEGLAVDGAGHLYIADAGAGGVTLAEPVYVKTTSSFGPTHFAEAAALGPGGVTYTVNVNDGVLESVTTHSDRVICRGLDRPTGVAYSRATKRLYVAQAANGTVSLVNPSTCALKVITYGLTGVGWLAPDSYGGLYAVQPGLGRVVAISAQGRVRVLATKLPDPTSVVQDAYGDLDVTMGGTAKTKGAIWRLLPGHKADVLLQHVTDPTGITADFDGDIYWISQHTVYENRGLLGNQIVYQGSTFVDYPAAVVSSLNGDLTVFPTTTHRTIRLRLTTTDYPI